MSFEIFKTYSLVAQALDYRAARQDMIASNIANADTPYYRPRDVDFKSALIAQKRKIYNQNSNKLEMAVTSSKHLKPKDETDIVKPTLFYRDGHMARNDGNSVDLDVETTEMSKNSVMFRALIQANKKEFAIFKSVLNAKAS